MPKKEVKKDVNVRLAERPVISKELWVTGSPSDVADILDSLMDQGYNTVEAVCKAFKKDVIVLK